MDAAVAHHAATVLLVRDGAAGVEVYLQRRSRHMGFAAGLWAFPGGRVDASDRDPAIDACWSGPPPDAWAERMDVSVDAARGYVVAACRETLEEAGVLLAEPAPAAAPLEAARRDVLSHARSFAAVLGDLDVRLDTGRLRYWAWWRTPAGEPRRYDTRFFVAALPPGATVVAHSGEVTDELWVSAPRARRSAASTLRDSVAARSGGEPAGGERPIEDHLRMLPPTSYTLRDVTAVATAAQVLELGLDRSVTLIQPVLDGDDILLPWGDRYRR
jgi:8-oxo-dGTP pyrophosphatase MutT (NUDIX family)